MGRRRARLEAPSRLRLLGRAVGAVAYLGTIGIALGATNDGGYFASLLVIVVFWIGGLSLALLVGDWFRFVNPFALVARAFERRERDEADGPPPAWTAAAMVAAFLWFWLVYAERVPTNLDTGVFLIVYGAAAIGGVVVFGAGWLEGGEGFTATFDLVGALSPIGRDAATGRLALRAPVRGVAERGPVPGTALLGAVLLGGIGYEGLSQTSWWSDSVVGGRADTELLVVSTVGLAWVILIAYVGIVGAARIGSSVADRDAAELPERVGAAAAILALGGWVAYELPQLIVDGQNVIALASDPLGRGDDLFGTINTQPNLALLSATTQAWIAIVALAIGVIAAAVLMTEAAFAENFSCACVLACSSGTSAAMAVVLAAIGSGGAALLLLGH